MNTLFISLLSPLADYFKTNSAKIDKKANSKKLFFEDFFNKMIFAFHQGIDSLRSLSEELESNSLCKNLGLTPTPFSTLKDGFSRFQHTDFEQLYRTALAGFDWMSVKSFEELGRFYLVDGSLFPTLIQMEWTSYKSKSNACKLHLALELNRMITTEFWIGSGKSSERNFLLSILQKGCTYIADRGYFSFQLVEKIAQAEAFFILRIKANIQTCLCEQKTVTHTVDLPKCFANITDQIITFKNNPKLSQYRLVCFTIDKKNFSICTNRMDINTLQIILLYAYRWQIELMFKFLKRTMNGLHLFNQSENGTQIQFYILLTLSLLQIRLKQYCQSQQEILKGQQENNDTIEQNITYSGYDPAQFIKNISTNFYESWKISKYFLIILKNNVNKVLDYQLIEQLANK